MATRTNSNYNRSSSNTNTGSPSTSDSDRIDIVSDETIVSETTAQPTIISIGSSENKRRDRRHFHRPYASSSNRIIQKGGRNNVVKTDVPERGFRYLKDIGNTLLNTRWRWILISLCIANAIAYVIFASLWMLIAVINDDNVDEKSEFPPCIVGANSFTGYLLLSIATTSTIGYGTQYPTECQPSWMVIMLQALTGVAIEGALVTAVFVKMSRPYSKDTMRLFSKKAVISMRDGVLCLMFRIRDINGKHWARTMIKAVLIKRRNSPEGEPLAYYFENLKLEKHGLMIWPQEIIHKITYDSPLWTVSPQMLYKARFEIMIILEGDSITTGQSSQSQTSYMNKEISWGYRFVQCVEYDKEEQKYVVDNEKFNEIVECDTPLCSAQELSGLLNEAIQAYDYGWDVNSMIGTPVSRRSEGPMASSPFRFPSFRMKKDIDGLPTDRTYNNNNNEAMQAYDYGWDNNVITGTPLSRRSEGAMASSTFRFPSFRTKKDIDGLPTDRTYNRQFSGATLATIDSVENLLDYENVVKENEDEEQKDIPEEKDKKLQLLSTNL